MGGHVRCVRVSERAVGWSTHARGEQLAGWCVTRLYYLCRGGNIVAFMVGATACSEGLVLHFMNINCEL